MARWPKASFVSESVKQTGAGQYAVTGKLTIRDKTLPVVFDLEIAGAFKDPGGDQRAAFTATTRINRKDFGLGWNAALETGGFLVGEDVAITLEVQFIKAA